MANRHKFKKGGKVQHDTPGRGEEEAKEAGLKTGGVAKLKTGGKVKGFKTGGRLDKRARGGGVGADKHPFSSAHVK